MLNARTIPVASRRMQLFSHLAQAGPSSVDIAALVEEFQRAQEQMFSLDTLKWVALLNLISIVAWWLSSIVVAREKGHFVNALKLWGVYTLGGILLFVLMIFAYMAAAASGSSVAVFGVAIGTILALVAVLLGAPMLVYDIGFFRSAGFVFIASAGVLAGELIAGLFLPPPPGAAERAGVIKKVTALPPNEQRRFLEALSQSAAKGSLPLPPEVIVADRSKTIEERQAALRTIHANLEKRRVELKWGDQAALDAYNRENARYQELAKELPPPEKR